MILFRTNCSASKDNSYFNCQVGTGSLNEEKTLPKATWKISLLLTLQRKEEEAFLWNSAPLAAFSLLFPSSIFPLPRFFATLIWERRGFGGLLLASLHAKKLFLCRKKIEKSKKEFSSSPYILETEFVFSSPSPKQNAIFYIPFGNKPFMTPDCTTNASRPPYSYFSPTDKQKSCEIKAQRRKQ